MCTLTAKDSIPSVEDVETWFTRSYQKSIGSTVNKESIYVNACSYFKNCRNKEALRRFLFETLGRNILDVHKDFHGIKMKRGRKSINYLKPKLAADAVTAAMPVETGKIEMTCCDDAGITTMLEQSKMPCYNDAGRTVMLEHSEVTGCDAANTTAMPENSEMIGCNDGGRAAISEQSEMISCHGVGTAEAVPGQSAMIGCDDTGTTAMPEQTTGCDGIDADTAVVIPGHREITSCKDPGTSVVPGESAMIVFKDTGTTAIPKQSKETFYNDLGTTATLEESEMTSYDDDGTTASPNNSNVTRSDHVDRDAIPEQVTGCDDPDTGAIGGHREMTGCNNLGISTIPERNEIDCNDADTAQSQYYFDVDLGANMDKVNDRNKTSKLASLSDEEMLPEKEYVDRVFERRSILSRSWSNLQIKEIRPQDLNC